jgi:hypothetical protein
MVTLRNLILVSSKLRSVTLALVGAICGGKNRTFVGVPARHRPHTSYNV